MADGREADNVARLARTKGGVGKRLFAGSSASLTSGVTYRGVVTYLLLRRGRRLNWKDDRDPLLYVLAAIQRLHFQSVPQQLQILVCTWVVRIRSRRGRRHGQ